MRTNNSVRVVSGGLLCLLAAGCGGGDDNNSNQNTRMAYAMTNGANGNAVVGFRRASDGTLTLLGSYATGGTGTGITEVSPATPNDGIDTLASQGSLAFSQDKRFLFAVNTASANVTSFRVNNDGSLTQVDLKPSGGQQPNCLGSYGSLLYVANVGNVTNNFASNVSGFRVANDGTLTAIASSTHALSTTNAQPARVSFNRNGSLLAVNELTTNRISVFRVNSDGTLGSSVVNNSAGAGPFGSYFLSNGRLLVAEAPAPPATGSVSSYNVGTDGTLMAISASVGSSQLATCWIIPTPDESRFYATNTANGTVSAYRVNSDGTITLLQPAASSLEGIDSGPVDGGVSEDGRTLYVFDSGKGSIIVHRIASDGTLTQIQTVNGQGLPPRGVEGLVVR